MQKRNTKQFASSSTNKVQKLSGKFTGVRVLQLYKNKRHLALGESFGVAIPSKYLLFLSFHQNKGVILHIEA